MATEVWANLASATVTSGGTTAPSAGTVQTWTLSGATFPAISSTASPPTIAYASDPAAPSEVFLITNVSGSTATVTRGADGTTPVTHAAGFTVNQVYAGATLRALQGPFFNVLNYGADPEGATDSSTAIQNAINDALFVSSADHSAWDSGATGYGCGTVVFPRGRYLCDSALNCTQVSTDGGYGVTLMGAGRQATSIVKNFTGALCTWDGSGGPGVNASIYGGLQDITLDGGGNTGALIQTASAQRMYFSNFCLDNNPDLTWDLTSLQDSVFIAGSSNNCGSNTHRVIEVKSDATGTCNMLHFIGCRIETFLLGAVGISNPSDSGGGNNGFLFTDCKFETVTVRGDIITADTWTQQLSLRDCFIAADSFASGYTTRCNGILYGDGTTGAGDNKLRVDNLSVYGSSTIASAVAVNGTNMSGIIRMDNIDCYDTPSVGLLNLTNMNASLAMTGDALPVVRTLTDAATIAVDASYGEEFRVTLTANRTLGKPTNAQDGKRIVVVVTPSTHTLSYATGINWGSAGAPTLVASKDNYLGLAYNATAAEWRALAFVGGF